MAARHQIVVLRLPAVLPRPAHCPGRGDAPSLGGVRGRVGRAGSVVQVAPIHSHRVEQSGLSQNGLSQNGYGRIYMHA
eukprot:8294645-Lingulodinium_polyedra.AAC.1